MEILDLSGSWTYRTDAEDSGIADGYYKQVFEPGSFMLPGSACENGIGRKQEYYDELSAEAVRAPRERYEYVAPLWLQREVDVPKGFEGKYLRLFLERVNLASELWIDGEKVGRQMLSLCTPHIYRLPEKLKAGKHLFTLRIDNRNLPDIGTMASGYSIDTQGYWNGIIGRIELQCEEIFHLENIQVYPKKGGIDVRLVVTSDVYSPFERRSAGLAFAVITPAGRTLETRYASCELYNSRQVEYFSYEIGDIQYWDEFHPALYTLQVSFTCGDASDKKSVRFGMREVRTEKKQILLNGKPIALRGTVDCAIYPLTGYPPMDIETWKRNFKIVKSYGLNHVRFHAWCPPKSAFLAADELGVYVSVEMPMWLNRDVGKLELGEDGAHRAFFTQEALRISKAYGNHPCFLMFSNGNENMGDFELLEDIILQMKAYDKRRLYTLTTNFDHPVLPCEDYLCAFEAGGHKVRLQDIQDEAAISTDFDYSEAVRDVPVPVISFEIGQYCVYPDVDGMEKYTGNMLPVNLDAIKKHMMKKHVYHRLRDYVRASGDLAVKLYKEEIEAALRTKDFGGFELLSLTDYTGQSTATVGILDVFFDSKGLTTPEEFRRFCGAVVPLLRAKRIYKNTETLEAVLDLYDYGQTRIEKPVFHLKIYHGDALFYEVKTDEWKVRIPLKSIERSAQLTVELSVAANTNSWSIFVFAEEEPYCDVKIIRTRAELEQTIRAGGCAVVTAECLVHSAAGGFIPVFWSPVFFPSEKPCGAIIDDAHPVFSDFPTGTYPDYQWKALLESSKGMDISLFGEDFWPIVETVPNFVDNTRRSPFFEAQVGAAKLLFCGFDLSAEDIASKQLKRSIFCYVASEAFCPKNMIDEKAFMDSVLEDNV